MKGKNYWRSILSLLVLFSICLCGYARQYKFYDTNTGLSSSLINKIAQDSDGHIWIATEDGLNRFDGNRFVVYRNIPGDTTSLTDNYVKCILEDRKQRLWITTLTGLCLYDPTTDRFRPYLIPANNTSKVLNQPLYLMEDHNGYIWVSTSGSGAVRIDVDKNEYTYFDITNSGICSNHINCIYEDRFGNIWFCSGREGLSIYNPGNRVFRTFRYQQESQNGLNSNAISSICEDTEGNVWIGTLTGGVNIYSFATQSFRQLTLPVSEAGNEIGSLMKDNENNIWIGTIGNGFLKYSVAKKRFDPQIYETPAVNVPRSKVQTMYEDCQGNIWMGCFQKGLFMIPKVSSIFTNHTFNPYSKEQQIGTEALQLILKDSYNNIWVSTDGDGLYRFDKDWTQKVHYKKGSEKPIPSNILLTLYEDMNENIWLGTYLNGALRYNRKKDAFDLNITQGEAPTHLLSNHVTDFREDADGNLWIATNGGGINIYNPRTQTFDYIVRSELNNDTTELLHNWCNLLHFDKDSLLWIATYGGLCTYDKKDNTFTYYTTKNEKLPNDIVISLEEDSKGNIWVGTQGGMVCINKKQHSLRKFTILDGLPNSVINGIKEDANGNIWVTTNYGLAMYNPETQKFTNYTTADGLITNELNRNAFTRSKDNEFFIGSMKGLISFFPTEIKREVSEPLNLVFSNLYIFNEQVGVGYSAEKDVLTHTINYTDKIKLAHEQNSFSIEFSALEYSFPEKVNYEVMMKGFDNQWRSVKNRMVTYTNLNPGNYTLIVRAWVNNKNHALVKEINIETLPPIWATPWAKSCYLILALVVGYLIFRYTRERLNVKRQEQLMQAKLQFFTDISHEIRTPLTLILSPLSKLISKNTDTSLLQTYNAMHKNGVRLLQLVNQIMDLRALEFGKKKLYVEETDITSFLRELKNSFNNLAEEKNLAYTFHSNPEKIAGFIDTDIITKILFNLISNAIKYTSEGAVNVSVETNQKRKLIISIEDTGKGISPDQQTLIFERFYMINTGTRAQGNSTGIGLHLTRKLVELHHGSIHLKSEPDKGSSFQVIIPYLKADYSQNELNPGKEKTGNPPTHHSASENIVPTEIKHTSKALSGNRHTVLVVEDNADIRALLTSEFGNEFHIIEAENGKEGLLQVLEKKPSLIISDILMPEMDGLELCKKIRNNETSRNIPFIMLTARSTMEQQIEGLEQGADAYIAKPFDINYLRATIERLISSHEDLKKKYIHVSTSVEVETPVMVVSQDEKLLKKLDEVIEKHLDNPELSVDILCKELGLSRTHLNRKMKELTGESPASYIRQIRLQKSARLLKTKSLTISEIAFTVGFSSPSYFSQAFRDYYGVTPKEYMGIDN